MTKFLHLYSQDTVKINKILTTIYVKETKFIVKKDLKTRCHTTTAEEKKC